MAESSRKSSVARALAGSTIAIAVATLLAGELVARFFDPADPRVAHGTSVFRSVGGLDPVEVDAIIEGDLDLFWKFSPNLSVRRWLRPLWNDTRTNALGLRDHDIAAAHEWHGSV